MSSPGGEGEGEGAPPRLEVTRIFSDEEGESHFGSFSISMTGSAETLLVAGASVSCLNASVQSGREMGNWVPLPESQLWGLHLLQTHSALLQLRLAQRPSQSGSSL
jgi:hypothetical protein